MRRLQKSYLADKSTILFLDFLQWIKTNKTHNTFRFQNKSISYLDHPYNHTKYNERAVEVPLIWEYLKNKKKKHILEVGNVFMHYYPPFPHTIVDKYEKADGVRNEDILTYNPRKKFEVIVSISTIEHIGWDEKKKEKMKIPRVIAHLYDLLAPGGEAFITFPVGYNAYLDEHLYAATLPFSTINYLKRTSLGNEWKEVMKEDILGSKYASPYPNANAICIGIIKKTVSPQRSRNKINIKRKRK